MPARRTVSVELDVKAAEARKQIRGSADDVRKLEASVVATGRGLDKMSHDTAQAGREAAKLDHTVRETSRGLDTMATNAHQAGRAADKLAASEKLAERGASAFHRELDQLDRQIDETAAHLKLLSLAYATTGDAGLLKQIGADRSLLRKLSAVRRDLTPAAAPLAAPLAAPTGPVGTAGGFLSGIPGGPMAIGIAAAAPIVAALMPTLGAAVGGAVLGGVGTGGIVGGVIAAAQDGRVQSEFKGMGSRLGLALTQSGQSFIGPLLSGVNELESAATSGINILRRGFEDLAPVLRPLIHGLDGMVTQLGPGLGKAFEAAKPALRALANELPEIGAALSDMFSSIADEGDGATMGLLAMLHAIEWLIRATGSFVATLAGMFEWMVRSADATTEWGLKILDVAAALSFLGGPAMAAVDAARAHLTALNTETGHLIKGLDRSKDSSNDFSASVNGIADTAEEAEAKIKDFADAIDELFGRQMNWDQAQIRLRDGMRDLVKELTNGARTLKTNSEEGDKNRAAILEQVGAIENLRDAYYRQTGSLDGANKMYDANLERLRTTLLRLGYNKKAVDDLINSYKIANMTKASMPVESPGLANVQSRLNSVANTLARLDGETTYHRFVTVYDSQYRAGERNPSARRWGGVTEHAADGLLREAKVYSPMGPARYAYAEPATRGEAFVPKSGDYGRSMSILGTAAAWYGASVVPGNGGGVMRVELVVSAAGAGRGLMAEISRQLRYEVRTKAGGSAEKYFAGGR